MNVTEFVGHLHELGFAKEEDGDTYSNGKHRVNVEGVAASAEEVGEHVFEEVLKDVEAELENPTPPPTVSMHFPEPHVRDKSPHQARIESFMTGCKQEVPLVPQVPDAKTRVLRARLILEEAMETIQKGLGVRLLVKLDGHLDEEERWVLNYDDLSFLADQPANLAEIADGCADISVVTYGTLSACGIADEALIQAVDENNLEKLEKGTVDEHGKLTKPPGHKPPEIEKILKDQGWSGE